MCAARDSYILPDGSGCAKKLLYSEINNGKFSCKDGLMFSRKQCRPIDGSWAYLQDVCNDEGRIISLAKDSCSEACGLFEEAVNGVCRCRRDAHLNSAKTSCTIDCGPN